MNIQLRFPKAFLVTALMLASTTSHSEEIKSTTNVLVSQSDCVVSDQEISVVGGVVGGTVGGAGGALLGRMVGGRTGGWIGGLVGGAVGGTVGSKGKTTYDCSVVVDNNEKPTLVRSITNKEVKIGDTVELYSLDNGKFHISNK